jgi:ElaB/YqjD/DUF883 family membrane-anchored ribosome-binding protein
MEVYFQNLTDKGVSIEKLAEDLMCLAEEVEGLVKSTSGNLGEQSQQELLTVVQRIKVRCEGLRQNALASAQATDRLIRRHPYASVGVVLGLGVLIGVLAARSRSEADGA